MSHWVKCSVCGERFDRDKTPFVKTSSRRYAHEACARSPGAQVESDRQILERYILNLFHINYITPKIRKQIDSYVNDYKYSYSGILKTLKYFFEVKGNSIEKANGGIGIVPYVWESAYKYYFSLWEAQEKNKDKNINEYVPEEIVIRIKSPQRKVKKKRLFSFLDKGE